MVTERRDDTSATDAAMTTPTIPALRALALVSMLAACGSSPTGTPGDDVVDAGTDTGTADTVGDDGGLDVGDDAAVDTTPVPDAAVDAEPGIDVLEDTPPLPDVGTDTVVMDVGVDTAPQPDTSVDAGTTEGTCFDFVQNGDETEVDCGGSCAPCLVQLGCDRACSERDVLDGACPVDGGDCRAVCDDLTSTWGRQVGAAVQSCIATDYLCFISLPDCVRTAMYPEAFDHDVVVTITGMEAYDGATVVVGVQTVPDTFETREAVLEGGRAEIRLPVTLSMRDTHLVLAYVDDDRDGGCDARTEPTMSGNAVSFEMAGVFGVPTFELTFDGSEFAPGRAPFVCEYL